ncbi:hypothetical protein [Streptomyces sp. NPDC058308]|uniref:hypothetical protein n=1 Tax=Streptomyces sp. NPDC058308 TaxID=3346440 RepID=UPI0036E01980
MSRIRVAVTAALLGMAALTACSSSSSSSSNSSGDKPDSTSDGEKQISAPALKPITKDLAQAQISQAVPGDGELLPGYSLHGTKSVTEGQYCQDSDDDSAPKGWVRGADASYEYNGSTLNMVYVHICLFETAKDAHRAYAAWKGDEKSKQQAPTKPVGDESTLVINPGISDDSVYGYSRSGKANIRVKVDGGTAGDPSGAQAMLTATLKRLQQAQADKQPTATAADEQATASK